MSALREMYEVLADREFSILAPYTFVERVPSIVLARMQIRLFVFFFLGFISRAKNTCARAHRASSLDALRYAISFIHDAALGYIHFIARTRTD